LPRLHSLVSYCKRLGIVSQDFEPNYTNDFLSWQPDAEVADPDAKQLEVAAYQKDVAAGRKSILNGDKAAATPIAAIS
jgi:pyrimidine precursor biosynthesis enzyme